jgi:hypothetical protein
MLARQPPNGPFGGHKCATHQWATTATSGSRMVGSRIPLDAPEVQYEKFMKLAGPYWMSCVTKNEAVPILAPDHCLTYLPQRV